jgi:tryptophan 2,3-dioxygenase
MTPMSFSAFRDRLDTASGFQSYQFREFEFVMGYKRPHMLKYAAGPVALAALEKRLAEPSVLDHFYDFLVHQGVAIPDELREKPAASADQPNEAIQRALLGLYTGRPELAILFESMTDLDEGFQEWKYRHVKLVERTIGNKKGTGGSLGVEFLKQSLFQPLFPDLWAIRHEL